MIDNRDLIINYEELLKSQNVDKLPPIFFRGTEQIKNSVAVLIKYACEHVLYFEPATAASLLTFDMLSKLKIKKVIDDYVVFPGGLSDESDKIRYILSLAYPRAGLFSHKRWVIDVYRQMLDTKKKGKKASFPKKFFTSENGEYNAMLCLDYFLSMSFDKTIPELYELFANTSEIMPLLRKAGLWTVCGLLYDKDPLLYLHFSLSDNDQDWFLLKYYMFKREYDKIKMPKPATREG